jgi:hypothetical protein
VAVFSASVAVKNLTLLAKDGRSFLLLAALCRVAQLARRAAGLGPLMG